MPSSGKRKIKEIINKCLKLQISVQTLPSLSDIVGGKVHISELRPVNIEDLLGRDPVKLNFESLTHMLHERSILVTGAGGSIGSELSKQILNFNPSLFHSIRSK